ncbi:MAG: WD40 repeat domain-containing protein [Cyanobacteria bacterium P01_F01_bin.116]
MTAKSRRSRADAFNVYWQGQLGDYITALAWSPAGDSLAASCSSGGVVIWTETDLIPLVPARLDSAIDCLEFSADGRYLAAAGQRGEVLVWQVADLDQPPIIVQYGTTAHWINQLTWHPGTPWLAFGVGSQIYVWEYASGEILASLDFKASSVLALDWHIDGTMLAASGHTGVKVWSGSDWEAEPEFIEVPGASISAAWSLDGRYLASGNLDRTLTVMSWGSPPPWLMQGFPGKVRQVAWAAPVDNQPSMVAAACVEGVTVWQRQGQGWENRVLEKHKGKVVAIAFHPTHRLLASAAQDGHLCLWKNAKSLQQTLKGVVSGFSAIAWHPQGTYLAAGGDQGEILIWKPTVRGQGFQ